MIPRPEECVQLGGIQDLARGQAELLGLDDEQVELVGVDPAVRAELPVEADRAGLGEGAVEDDVPRGRHGDDLSDQPPERLHPERNERLEPRERRGVVEPEALAAPDDEWTVGRASHPATMLIFGILGGSFIQLENMPASVQMLSRITPNAWALDGFTTLALGGTLLNLFTPIIALLTMGGILFVISVLLFGKKNLVQK